MHYQLRWIYLLLLSVVFSCKTSRQTATNLKDDGRLELIFVQVNDVYEIAPTSAGKAGGMARVATIKNEMVKQNRNTFLVMAGDFVSPSVYNSLTYQGKRIRGKQMVESMNAASIDFAVFGNHEFDITETELQERLNESTFKWIASNTFHKTGSITKPFSRKTGNDTMRFPTAYILPLTDQDGTSVKIGIIGITIPFNKAEYVEYTDPVKTATELYNQIKDSCDAVVAITHQTIANDILLAKQLPGLAAILGGHEHDMRFEKTGQVYITKAHANAKSAYIVTIAIDKKKKTAEVRPTLKMLDESVAIDSNTNAVVSKWTEIANANYASQGFDAKKIIIFSGDSLDGRDAETRSRSTNLTELIPKAMAFACPQSAIAIMNAGSIRLDDILYPPITQYDILRSLPFGGPIREADITGALLLQTLEAGRKNRRTGGYLHSYPVKYVASENDTAGVWQLNGVPIEPGKPYRVAFSEFLITGREANLEFLHKENAAMIRLYEVSNSAGDIKSDIRSAIIKYLENTAGTK